MKTNKLLIVLSSLTLAASVFVGLNLKKDHVVAKAIDINDYSSCQTAYSNNNASGLLTELRTITSPGSSGSYDQLWSTYCTAYVRADGKIFDYYSSITNYVPGGSAQGAGYKKEGDSYNREHSIPKSWWGGSKTNQGADPYIVVPTDGYVNNARGNDPFGMVGSADKTFSNSKWGSVASGWGLSGNVFEPDDSVKGDFARIYYYAIAKYSASSGWTSGEGSTCFSGSSSTNFGLTNYAIKLFSYWSELDPVSEWEMSVNDKVAPIQGNRNPFIDHPEYANVLWGTNSNYTQYTHGVPSADGISISKTEAFLISNNTTTISATATDSSTISWTTSNSGVVSLSSSSSASGANITLTAHSAGTATITASATIGGETYTKECSIEVAATKQVTSIEISTPKTNYRVDDTFVKPTVTASYNDGTSSDVTNSATFSGYNMSVAGNYTVTVSYSYGGADKSVSYSIIVKESGGGEPGEEVTLDIDFTGNKSSDTDSKGNVWAANGEYTTDSSYIRLNSSGAYISNSPALCVDTAETMSITANLRTWGGAGNQTLNFTAYNEDDEPISNTLTLTPADKNLKPYSGTLTFTNSGDHEITIKAVYSTNNYSIGISSINISYISWEDSPKTLTGIGVNVSPRVDYFVGNYFDPEGLVITRTYDDDSSDTYAYAGHTSEFSFDPSPSTPLTVEYDDVEITYGGHSCYLPINVDIPKELTSITISGFRTAFTEGDAFEFGGTVTAHYSNLSTEDVTSSATFTGYDTTVVGNQTVIVSYGDSTKNYDITVSAGTLSSISVSGMTTTYVKNASFSFDGLCNATFENGYEKEVTPTGVSTPDMSTAGNKQVTVSYSYNGQNRSTSYNITVNSYRVVMEEIESEIGTITYTTDKEVISDQTLSTSSSGDYSKIDTQYHAWRLGASGKTGTLTVKSTSTNIYKIVVNARYYSSDSGTRFTIGGTSYNLTSSYIDYTKAFDSAVNQVAISSVTNGKRVLIASIVVYTKTEEDIGQTEDCVGLETFINTYMHMDYVENLGYCKDDEHHYYATAKNAFNNLNEHQRSLFTGNSAYLAEWTRLSTWASKNKDSLNNNNQLVISDNSNSLNSDSSLIIIIAISAISTCTLLGLLIVKKRKEHK